MKEIAHSCESPEPPRGGAGPDEEKATISVVIPVFNSKLYLNACLDSILRAIRSYGPAELTVIDNGSTDGSYEILLNTYSSSARVRQIKNATIASLRNYGAHLSSGEYLCFIDSDCVVPEDYFHHALRVVRSVDADAAGSSYRLPPHPHWIEATWQDLHERPADGYVRFINSGNFVIKRRVFECTGGFCEALTTGEDSEYCLRLVHAGFKLYDSRDISAIHLGNPKSLAAFFRKQEWHGLGAFGSLKLSFLDKPLWMTLAFALLTIGSVLGLFFFPLNIPARVSIFALFSLCVPVVTVGYRAARRGRLRRPLRSTLLYWLYYAARVRALLLIGLQRVRQDRDTNKAVC